jgi:hypothetical protein
MFGKTRVSSRLEPSAARRPHPLHRIISMNGGPGFAGIGGRRSLFLVRPGSSHPGQPQAADRIECPRDSTRHVKRHRPATRGGPRLRRPLDVPRRVRR